MLIFPEDAYSIAPKMKAFIAITLKGDGRIHIERARLEFDGPLVINKHLCNDSQSDYRRWINMYISFLKKELENKEFLALFWLQIKGLAF